MKSAHVLSFFVVALVLAACSTVPPTSPDVLALPPAGKNLAQFNQDDSNCRSYAQGQTGGAVPQQNGARKIATGAVVGNGVGAPAGAPAGAAAGAGHGSMSTEELQLRYDIAYAQCMTAQGNTVQPPPYGWDYGSYAYPYPDWPYYGPWLGPAFTFGFFGVHGFHHHGFHDHEFAHHGIQPHGSFHGGIHGASQGGFHRG